MAGEASVENFYSMRQARDIIDHCVRFPLEHSNRTLFFEGPPGIGKTAMCNQVYEDHKRTPKNPDGFTHFVPYVAPERDPMEWGLPMPNKERNSIYMMPLSEFVWGPSDRVFFLADEIDKANNMMQNVLARIAHEHRVHNVVLPPGSLVCMAGNRITDRAGGFTANSHIKGRRTRVPLGVDHKEWIEDVAIRDNLHSSVISYIRTSPQMLTKFDPNLPTSPMPRAWSKVGEQLNHQMEPHVERALIEGDLGKETANTFWGHLRIHRELRSVEEVCKNPDRIPLPHGPNAMAIMWAEVTALARAVEGDNADLIFRYFNRLDGEFAFCGYKDVLLRDFKDKKSRVAKSKHGQKWMIENGDMITKTA